jgi:hypothetical protein
MLVDNSAYHTYINAIKRGGEAQVGASVYEYNRVQQLIID